MYSCHLKPRKSTFVPFRKWKFLSAWLPVKFLDLLQIKSISYGFWVPGRWLNCLCPWLLGLWPKIARLLPAIIGSFCFPFTRLHVPPICILFTNIQSNSDEILFLGMSLYLIILRRQLEAATKSVHRKTWVWSSKI